MAPDGLLPAAPQLAGDPGLYFTPDDAFRITTFGNVAGVKLRITGRLIEPRGFRPKPFQCDHTPNSDRTTASSDQFIGEGWLQNITVTVASGTPGFGGVFVVVDVIRGNGTAASVVATLLQGFVTARQRLAWPGSPLASTISSPGTIRSITGTNPAAGVEISETVPVGARWKPIAIRFALVTDATVANRGAVVTFDDGAAVFATCSPAAVQTASSTSTYTFGAIGNNQSTIGQALMSQLPAGLVLLAGYRIRTASVALQAADDYSAPQLLVEEILEG